MKYFIFTFSLILTPFYSSFAAQPCTEQASTQQQFSDEIDLSCKETFLDEENDSDNKENSYRLPLHTKNNSSLVRKLRSIIEIEFPEFYRQAFDAIKDTEIARHPYDVIKTLRDLNQGRLPLTILTCPGYWSKKKRNKSNPYTIHQRIAQIIIKTTQDNEEVFNEQIPEVIQYLKSMKLLASTIKKIIRCMQDLLPTDNVPPCACVSLKLLEELTD